jgi:hypothetical protein
LLQRDPVGEAILLGDMLIGIDFEGDEPGDDSKCMMVVYGVGLLVYIHTYGRCRPKRFARSDPRQFFVKRLGSVVGKLSEGGSGSMMYDADVVG